MQREQEEVLFIVTNYSFATVDNFMNSLEESKTCKEILDNFDQAKIASIRINGLPIPNDGEKVIALFNQKDGNIQFRYNHINKTLELASKDFDKDKEFLCELLVTFAQLKAQEISSVIYSFAHHYNIKKDKLKMFNPHIHEQVTDFNNNTGFTVTLPVDLGKELGCQAIYEVSKVAGSDEVDHVYRIASSFNFDFTSDNAIIIKRFEELECIKNKIDDIYNKFVQTSTEIINLNKHVDLK